jgi:hypothetical protein
MAIELWKLTGNVANLDAGIFSVGLDIARPSAGLRIQQSNSNREVSRLFQLSINGITEPSLSDAYVRFNDLIVNYGHGGDCPFTVQVVWRLLLSNENDRGIAVGLEACVSTQTELLSAQPEVMSRTDFPCKEVYELYDDGFKQLGIDTDRSGKRSGQRCVLFRAASDPVSYVEMVHPSDLGHSEFVYQCDRSAATASHVLSNRWMEKGVIVRSRARGLIVDGKDDLAIATSAYREFCQAELPLSA